MGNESVGAGHPERVFQKAMEMLNMFFTVMEMEHSAMREVMEFVQQIAALVK